MRPRSQGGFTLLELTIVLAIVGLLAVGALKAVSALRENAGISETSKRLNTLVMALQTFLMKNNRLPCPADPKLPNTHSNFGLEARDLGDLEDPKDDICLPEMRDGTTYQGVIPGRTLGLSGGRLMDAWDRQFTYVVIAEATQDNSFTSNAWPATLELRDKARGKLIQQGIAVIISHGANGSDAYLTTIPKLPNLQDEEANLDNDHIFVQADYSINDDNPFDDQVLLLTEDQIVQPLANQGALITKQAQALEKLKRIENALIGHMAVDTQDPAPGIPCKPSRKARRAIPKPISGQKRYPIIPPSFVKKEVGFVTIQGRGDIYDPWGQPTYYEVDGKITDQNGCEAGFYNSGVKGKVFTLKSFGPNRRNDDDTIKDDIVINRYREELIGVLAAAGIKIDGTEAPP
jgi:prepilin-type N-terminal cleavage/methylation domain-containing protein